MLKILLLQIILAYDFYVTNFFVMSAKPLTNIQSTKPLTPINTPKN